MLLLVSSVIEALILNESLFNAVGFLFYHFVDVFKACATLNFKYLLTVGLSEGRRVHTFLKLRSHHSSIIRVHFLNGEELLSCELSSVRGLELIQSLSDCLLADKDYFHNL